MMRMTIPGMVVAMSVLAGTVAAQDVHGPGYYTTGSVSLGGADERCSGCPSPQRGGFDGLGLHLGVARTLGPSLRAGLEGTWWSGSFKGFDRRMFLVSAIVAFQPTDTGFFFDGGIGYLNYQEKGLPGAPGAPGTRGIEKASGVGLQAGLGYEIPITGPVTVVPFLRLLRSILTSTTINGQPGDPISFKPGMFYAGIGVRWGPF